MFSRQYHRGELCSTWQFAWGGDPKVCKAGRPSKSRRISRSRRCDPPPLAANHEEQDGTVKFWASDPTPLLAGLLIAFQLGWHSVLVAARQRQPRKRRLQDVLLRRRWRWRSIPFGGLLQSHDYYDRRFQASARSLAAPYKVRQGIYASALRTAWSSYRLSYLSYKAACYSWLDVTVTDGRSLRSAACRDMRLCSHCFTLLAYHAGAARLGSRVAHRDWLLACPPPRARDGWSRVFSWIGSFSNFGSSSLLP